MTARKCQRFNFLKNFFLWFCSTDLITLYLTILNFLYNVDVFFSPTQINVLRLILNGG